MRVSATRVCAGYSRLTTIAAYRLTWRDASARCWRRSMREGDKVMPMKNPLHPGHLIKDMLDELGLSVAEAAAGLGVTRQQLHRVVAGRSGISPEMALRLEQGIGSTARLWLALQSTYDLAQLQQRADAPRIGKLTSPAPA